jgi:hypothetical protein
MLGGAAAGLFTLGFLLGRVFEALQWHKAGWQKGPPK